MRGALALSSHRTTDVVFLKEYPHDGDKQKTH